MKKYRVLLAFNAYQEYEVEAENQSEALDRAEKLAPPASGFCEAERHPDGDIVEEVQSEFSPAKAARVNLRQSTLRQSARFAWDNLRRKKMLKIKLSEEDAVALAIMCKRAFKERVEKFAVDEIETKKMLQALTHLEEQLFNQGYSPR